MIALHENRESNFCLKKVVKKKLELEIKTLTLLEISLKKEKSFYRH